jgi:hypothetical protein
MAQNQPNLNQTRQDIIDIAAVTEETFRSVAANIQDMFANALNASDTIIKSFQKDISNSIKSAARESSKLADNFEKLNQGALKQADIQKQIEARAAKLRSIEVSTEALRKIGTAEAISQANELNQQYQDLVLINQSYTEELNNQVRILDEVDNNLKTQLGLAPQILGGLDKSLKKLGLPDLGFNKALEDTRKIAIQNELNGERTNIWATYTKNLGGNFKEVLSKANFIQVAIGLMIDSFLKLDNLAGDTAKSMGISYEEATQLNSEFNAIANASGNIFVTTKGINESFNQINTALGTNANLSEELLLTQTELTKQAFYSVEAATQISKLSLATGQSSKNIVTSFLGQAKALNLVNNTAINEKQLIEGISKTSKGILATFAAQPKKLIEAAFAAKKVGLELNEIKGIQDSLLNIESSIAAEFEAEVLTGKQLNLERARYYALTNNIAGLSQELTKQGIDQTKFAGMNVLQQESVAQAMGLSRDQLGEMLLEQAALSKLTGGDTEENRKKLALLKEQGFSAQAIAELGQDELDRQMASASIQDRFNASIEKLKEIFVTVVQALMPIIDIFASVFELLGPIMSILDPMIQATLVGVAAIQDIVNGIKYLLGTIFFGKSDAFKGGSAFIKQIGKAEVSAQQNYGANLGFTEAGRESRVQDGIAPSSKGPFTITDSYGATAITSVGDGLAVSPNIRTQSAPPTQTTSPTAIIDYEKLGTHLAQAVSKVTVQSNLDGVAVSSRLQTPMGIATRKI